MRETAMVREAESGAAKSAEDIEVRGFGGECKRERGKGGFTVEAGASQARAGQEVGDGFQAVKKDSMARAQKCQQAEIGTVPGLDRRRTLRARALAWSCVQSSTNDFSLDNA